MSSCCSGTEGSNNQKVPHRLHGQEEASRRQPELRPNCAGGAVGSGIDGRGVAAWCARKQVAWHRSRHVRQCADVAQARQLGCTVALVAGLTSAHHRSNHERAEGARNLGVLQQRASLRDAMRCAIDAPAGIEAKSRVRPGRSGDGACRMSRRLLDGLGESLILLAICATRSLAATHACDRVCPAARPPAIGVLRPRQKPSAMTGKMIPDMLPRSALHIAHAVAAGTMERLCDRSPWCPSALHSSVSTTSGSTRHEYMART